MGRGEKRHRADINTRIERLEKRDQAVRHRDATIGLCFIFMAIGWNKIAEALNHITLLSFTYNKGWGFFQMSVLLIGGAFITCALYRVKIK